MAIETTYAVMCDICGTHYDDTHANEDIMSLYSRMWGAGWRQKCIGDMPTIMCPRCSPADPTTKGPGYFGPEPEDIGY